MVTSSVKVSINLVGAPAMYVDGRRLRLKGPKTLALVCLLASRPGHFWPRTRLIDLLWEESSIEAGRTCLRQLVLTLKRSMEGAAVAVLANRDAVALDDRCVEVDIHSARAALRGDSIESLIKTTALLDGELMEGIDCASSEFEDWIGAARSEHDELLVTAMLGLAERHAAIGEVAKADAVVSKLLRFDTLNEPAHRMAMQLSARAGDVALTWRRFHRCKDVLAENLAVSPSPETIATYREVMQSLDVNRENFVPEFSKVRICLGEITHERGSALGLIADGVREELGQRLANIVQIQVLPNEIKNLPVDHDGMYSYKKLSGSIRRSGASLRVSLSLVDGDGCMRWATTVSGTMDQRFEVEDAAASSALVGISSSLLDGAMIERWSNMIGDKRILARLVVSWNEFQQFTSAHLKSALSVIAEVRSHDPGSQLAALLEAKYTLAQVTRSYCRSDEEMRKVLRCAERVLKGVHGDVSQSPDYWVILAQLRLQMRRYDLALEAALEAVKLAPSEAEPIYILGQVYGNVDKQSDALVACRRAVELRPRPAAHHAHWLVRSYIACGNAEAAYDTALGAIGQWTSHLPLRVAGVWSAVEAGEIANAKSLAQGVLTRQRDFSVSREMAEELYIDRDLISRFEDSLRIAGLS